MEHAPDYLSVEPERPVSAPAAVLLQGVLDASPCYVLYCEPVRTSATEPGKETVVDFVYRVVNARMCQLIGQPADRLINRRMTEFSSTVKATGLFERYVTALETARPIHLEWPHQVDGLDCWYLITVEPLMAGIVVSMTDISDQKRAELRARQQAEEMRATLNASLNSILLMRAIRNGDGQIVDFRIETANQAVVNSLFRQPDELVGRTLLEVFPGNVESGFFALYARVANTGQAEQAEYYYQDVNGFSGWFEVSAVRQEADLIVLTFNNVTAQRNAQLAQQGQAQVLQAILDHSQTAISLHEPIRDKQGHVVDFQAVRANRQAILNWGPVSDAMLRESFLTNRPDARGSEEFARYVRVIETGTPETFEFTHAGRQYDITIVGADGGVVMSAVDVTADRQYQHELEALNRNLKQSNESLHSFAYVASHDLQEPLRKIQTFSDILQNQFQDNLSEGERDMAGRIQKSASRMQQLIKDLLAYSQVTTRHDAYGPVALNSVVADVSSDLEVSITEKNAVLQTADLPTVLGSVSQLRQLMQNLIANALKFQPAGRIPIIRITVRAAQPDELPTGLSRTSPYWLISVIDNGTGFDEKYKERIFQLFQRLHDKVTYGGTGIGLAICQRVAESHGGAIDVSSRPGEGTTFLVFLPVYQPLNNLHC